MATFSRREQSNKRSYFIDRAQNLPYIPFYTTPLGFALAHSNEQIFTIKRNSLVPRVALVFNEGTSTENAGYIKSQADLLKNQGIKIIAVAIGSDTSIQQLSQVVSDPHTDIIQVTDHDSIFDKVNEITKKVCHLNARVYFDRKESILSGKLDYRYFELDIRGRRSDLIEIEVEELNGITNLYYSFTNKNPTYETSEKFYKTTRKRSESSEKIISSSLIFVDPGVEKVYFTIEGIAVSNQINLIVKNIDFN